MSSETQAPEMNEVDPAIMKVTTAWKRVKKVEKELTDQQANLDLTREKLEQAIVEAEHAELENVAGNDEFRKKYEHKIEKIRRHRKQMDVYKQAFKAEKDLLRLSLNELEEIDKASKEEAMPIIKASKGQQMSEAWRETPMEHLAKISKNPLSESVVTKLVDAGYDTLGKLTDYKSSGSWYTDIDGIGKATSDKIDDAVEQFFAEWNALASSAVPVEEEAEVPAVNILAKPLAEVEGITEAALKSLAAEKIATIGDLDSKAKEMGEDFPLWMECTVGKQEAQSVKESLKKLAQAA
jgi:hypothetical protein